MIRKILVPIDIENPERIIKDILYPRPTENGLVLTAIKADTKWDYGMVILTGEINENEILKKIVDSEIKITSVPDLLKTLKDYIREIPNYKIGNILELVNVGSKLEFRLKYERLSKTK